ncbi:hypothetical protein cce_0906 [Crocosphaera subtropica ATCC 51142]|uniref:Myosin heavy chain n=1 Tax=Crocosphaera subtropica (strain ATCC 51142 / BH68) TaxID=43989 RepID=B1WS63_CROS5|nr:hypothetical protein [Crocosphaera subtropica]ACB50257.1 hypothetical protein cce_0906 [Crocosphaera subtropica ATCC 51142]
MAQKINSKNTKSQILEAYEELMQEKSALESQVKQLTKTPQVTQTITSNNQDSNSAKKKVMTAANTLFNNNITLTIESLEKVQNNFGSAVSHLSEQLIAEASLLAELNKIATEELAELEELHNIETIEDETLSNLIEEYQTTSKTNEEELSKQQDTLAKELEELQKNWHKEKQNYNREIQEREQEYLTNKKREQEQYTYNVKLERQLDEEQYQAEKQGLYQELKETRETQEKQWQEKEENISQQEKEQQETKAKLEQLQEELEQKIKQAKEEGKGIGTYQAKIKSDLRSKEIEGEKHNYELRIVALEETINNQEIRQQKLSQQLEASLKQVQDLAVKAIEGSSNRNSFEAMKEIAIEQAKNQQKNK